LCGFLLKGKNAMNDIQQLGWISSAEMMRFGLVS